MLLYFLFYFFEKLWILLLDDALRFWTIYFAFINIYLLRTIFSAHMALLHWQPMPHQHIIIFWVNLFKSQNKLISHSTTWIRLTWPARSLLQEADSCPHFLFINWDHNPMTSSTSTYGLGLSNESKFTAHITSLTLMTSGFFNKSPYLHKMTTKLEVRHVIFGLWPKLISFFGETLGVVVWRAKRYVQ